MSGRHTPAPWVVIPAAPYEWDDRDCMGGYLLPALIEGADGSPVCQFGSEAGSGTMFENEDDYHLISAAPDLLAALEYMLTASQPRYGIGSAFMAGAQEAAREAIAKALGK